MRILFVAHTYPRWSGDRAGAQVFRFALEARARGHQVLVVAPHAMNAKEGDETLDGIDVRRFRYAGDLEERIGYQGAVEKSLGVAALKVLPTYLSAFRKAVRVAEASFAPDVVSVHWWAPAGLATARLRTPIAITCHGSDVRLLGNHLLVRLIGRRVLRGATGVSAVSQTMANDLHAWGGVQDVTVTPMPVDDARFSVGVPRSVPPVVMYAGNLIRAKGVDLILQAAALLKREGISFRLQLVGDGPDRDDFERLVETLQIGDAVEWHGTLGHDLMGAEFAAASVFVLASRGPRGEGMPLTIVEALVSGCAVVATPAGGIPELIEDEVSGLLVRDGDATHLAAQLKRVLGDPALRDRLAAEGRKRAMARHGRQAANDRFFDFLTATAQRGKR